MNPGDQDAKHNLELALSRINPPAQREQQNNQQDQRDDHREQQEQNEETEEQQGQEQERQEDRRQGGQDQESRPQVQPMTEAQAQRVLESVGRASQTLQERRGQVLVSPNPPSGFDW